MQQLVNDLLKFSRHINDVLDFEKTNLNDLLTDVLSDMEIDIQKRKQKYIYSSLPTIYAIPSQIRQLFQNLISNSLKFSQQDANPVINIETEVLKGSAIPGVEKSMFDNTFYNIYVRDNGIGFDTKYSD
jgi:signal transduction histidine kinase